MYAYQYGGKKGVRHRLTISDDFLVVRTQNRGPLEKSVLTKKSRQLMGSFVPVARFEPAGVEIFRTVEKRRLREIRNRARATLKKETACQFAGRALCDPKSGAPVLYTENLFVKFDDDLGPRACRKLLREFRLKVKRELEYARNAYFVAASEGTGVQTFRLAGRLLSRMEVEFCHPELIRQVRRRGAFPQQWHLKKTTIGGQLINAHANVEPAWQLTQGQEVTIAVIDDGLDIEHEEFSSGGKIVAPRDVTRGNNDPRPGPGNNHGTACAGVACANGRHGASGVASEGLLMPIRLVSGLGSQPEADAFIWAAQNGADVISCSWGPVDGAWWNPNDPLHRQVVPLPDSTRLAIDWAIRNGRNGKGCVITWAAGNGNESVDNDGYASYSKVIAVAACNDSSKRSAYSDFGQAVWCAFPSNDTVPGKTPGIWTTDRSGVAGYNEGNPARGDAAGHYANDFGGTSSACPGVAGVAALVLARNPSLRWDEVKDILRRSCDRIDSAGGHYDAQGHSTLYGYGRLNAEKAVALALPPQPRYQAIHTAVQDVPIKDLQTSTLAVAVGDTNPLTGIKVVVEIEHTYIEDLIVRLLPPAASGAGGVVLHNRTGGGRNDLKRPYDGANTPALTSLLGINPQGNWTLEVQDAAKEDTGKIRRFSVELTF